jgi:Tat protein secretion system quality control protein TatD with DNase activity
LRRVLELGFLVSFTGIVTFKNGQNVRDSAAAAPAGRFMLETDSPYMAPLPNRGKRCEPAYVREIAETVAAVRGATLAELSTRRHKYDDVLLLLFCSNPPTYSRSFEREYATHKPIQHQSQ